MKKIVTIGVAKIRSRWPDATAAHNAVSRAIKKGTLKKPSAFKCTDCTRRADQYDHFRGYAKQFRLTVQPVCPSCHGKRMVKRGERKVVRGKAHWSYKHGRSGKPRSEMSAKDKEIERLYHLSWRRKNEPPLRGPAFFKKRKRIGPLRQRGQFFSSAASSRQWKEARLARS